MTADAKVVEKPIQDILYRIEDFVDDALELPNDWGGQGVSKRERLGNFSALTRSEDWAEERDLVDNFSNGRECVLIKVDEVLQQRLQTVVAVIVRQALVTTEISKKTLSSAHVVPKAP